MVEKNISIMYGMPIGPPVGYLDAKDIFFPNCDEEIIGGCIVDKKNPKYRKKCICEQCNEIRDKWIMENNSNIRWL
jgi:hypothetical protein